MPHIIDLYCSKGICSAATWIGSIYGHTLLGFQCLLGGKSESDYANRVGVLAQLTIHVLRYLGPRISGPHPERDACSWVVDTRACSLSAAQQDAFASANGFSVSLLQLLLFVRRFVGLCMSHVVLQWNSQGKIIAFVFFNVVIWQLDGCAEHAKMCRTYLFAYWDWRRINRRR